MSYCCYCCSLLLFLSLALSLLKNKAQHKQLQAGIFRNLAGMATPATRARSLALYRALMRSAKAMPTYNRQEHVIHETRRDVSPALTLGLLRTCTAAALHSLTSTLLCPHCWCSSASSSIRAMLKQTRRVLTGDMSDASCTPEKA
jgi:Complex 1 protein (LYR family)